MEWPETSNFGNLPFENFVQDQVHVVAEKLVDERVGLIHIPVMLIIKPNVMEITQFAIAPRMARCR